MKLFADTWPLSTPALLTRILIGLGVVIASVLWLPTLVSVFLGPVPFPAPTISRDLCSVYGCLCALHCVANPTRSTIEFVIATASRLLWEIMVLCSIGLVLGSTIRTEATLWRNIEQEQTYAHQRAERFCATQHLRATPSAALQGRYAPTIDVACEDAHGIITRFSLDPSVWK